MKIGRNDPCPCGSGKKYKQCHLAQQQVEAPAEPDAIAAQRKAHDWLLGRFGKREQREIFVDYLGVIIEESSADKEEDDDELLGNFLEELNEGDHYVLDCGLNDWALHETQYERHGSAARGIDWVLGARDLHLTAPQRAFLQATAAARLCIYEVTAVELNGGLHLRDVQRPDMPALFVHEMAATHALKAGSLLATRVIARDGHFELGSAIYPLSPIGVLEILLDTVNLRDDADDDGHILSWLIRDNWLRDHARPPLLRAMPIARAPFIEDRYVVSDAPALKTALDACDDVETFGHDSPVWMYTSAHDDEQMHVMRHPLSETGEPDLSALTMDNPDAQSADSGRTWLEHVAGAFVQHRERVRVEPPDEDIFRLPLPLETDDAAAPGLHEAQVHEELVTRYENWCDTPLDILDARTPRAMLGDSAGRFRVELLLRIYDDVEAAFARRSGRAPVSFDFLRERLGLPGKQ